MRRAVGVLALLVGLGLLVVPLAYSMFDRTADAERVLDRFEFLTLGSNPGRYLVEAETTRSGSAELVDEAIPSLASRAGISEAAFERVARTGFPALAGARQEVRTARDFSVRYSRQLEAVDEKFQSVYDIPIAGLPLTATPWLFLLAGVGFLGAGAAVLVSSGRAALALVLVLGALTVLGPVVLGAHGKAADGEDVKDFASRGLTARAAAAAQSASSRLDAVVRETDERTLPYVARQAGISEERLNRELVRDFPAAAAFLAQWDVIGPRLSRLADAVSNSVEEFRSAERLPIAIPVWLLLGAGVATTGAAGIALVRGRGTRDG